MKYVLIDADTGIDDSLAILYALKSPNFHVEGITTCFGNNCAEQSADNCLRLIQLAKCGYEVPVAVGANESLDHVFSSAPAFIHGDNGIGNVELPETDQKPINRSACDFIIQKSEELKGELIIITTGRMTNLAMALNKDPFLPQKVKKVVAMGGCYKVPGNVSPYAEANIHGDARAADMVFKAGFHLTVVGLDVTMKTFITQAEVDNLCEYCSEECRPIAEYIKKAFHFYFEFHRVSMGMAHASVVHDPLAVLIAEDPSLGIYEMVRAGVEHQSEKFTGMIITDEGFVPTLDRDEISICTQVDSVKAVRRLFSVFQDMEPGRYNNKN